MAADAKAPATDGRRKVAAFLLALDAPVAAQVMRGFTEQELSALAQEMASLGKPEETESARVLAEFVGSGADDKRQAERLLRTALGEDKAKALLSKAAEPFRDLRKLGPKRVAAIVKGEHPQVLATVLAHLDAGTGKELLNSLDEDLRYDVLRRIALTPHQPPEMVRQVDALLAARASAAADQGDASGGDGRFKTVADLLNLAGPKVTKSIMEKLSKELPAEAAQVQALMFLFEDMILIGDREMQKMLGELDKTDLVLALKTASPELKEKILGNLSKRARETMQEEMEMVGPKPLAEVEAAQKRIVEVVRAMEERGDLKIERGSSEAMV